MENQLPRVAYFCMEYGLDNNFKIYSGGLGILAGDLLKAAKEQNKPVMGVGIKWKQGYTEQRIDEQGNIYDCFRDYDYDFLVDTGVKVRVKIRQDEVYVKVWKANCFGNVDLYLLDTDLAENKDRGITGRLYQGFTEERIAQEMVLGLGGVRALRALNLPVEIYHFNEGQAALAGLELIREKMESGKSFEEAWELTRQEVVFTTHTPIKAGNESHSLEALMYMGANLGLSIEQISQIGGVPFNMTVAALRLSKIANAVSKLHTETANRMWEKIENRAKIIGITNGIHRRTWVDVRMSKDLLSLEEIRDNHREMKKELIDFIEKRCGVRLSLEALLVGFSRRVAAYKRNDLLFKEEGRLEKYWKEGKIQVVFSGKAHPSDKEGKEIISTLVKIARRYPNSVVFLENYDMEIGKMLTRGCDVWLNTPRRPNEACGTSGMKAAMNGVLNCSTLDGWWAEACQDGLNGWAIGDEVIPETVEEQDEKDARALYDTLLEKVIPTYYNCRQRWLEMMKESIESTKTFFSMDRMLDDYYRLLYQEAQEAKVSF